ncbi:phospholipase D-like domain-containing protein [uncultured Pluralibacter sp.]|uniref:phospholipase D-like domain-containing protein n=1 Tax=uncultured Pluralibacter sp. TaxID=1490864 RepID=UPI0026028573|nr:phospholipase D-like domain-containing protein [uncultured Pluralibacter sp.]
MSQSDIVVPVATLDTGQCRITPPWFVQNTEYQPVQATYKPLVNGEEAFAAVHHAIENAKKSVDIICWGFQPSMYFIRDGKHPCIGELLIKIAREKNVRVRVLAWEMPGNLAGLGGESNLPGKGIIRFKDRAGQTATEQQYQYDRAWFSLCSSFLAGSRFRPEIPGAVFPEFVSRGFNLNERTEIAYRAALQALDKDISADTIGVMSLSATHHQKTVLVDYELPENAVGFVMGHNSLDEYWDTDAHSSQSRSGLPSDWGPDENWRGKLPRQDISSRVTGPILEHLHENFATAWKKETGQDLIASRDARSVAKKLKPRPEYGTPIMAQLLRTQAQENRRDIEKLYLQAINNATQFIYIENQYFRWPPLAEAITQVAKRQISGGRRPEIHGPLHLFVTTNVTDEGIGAGTVNTQRMLDVLGRADTIPEITKLRKIAKASKEILTPSSIYMDPGQRQQREKELSKKIEEYQRKEQEIKDSVILPEERPGLKVHICSLVAPDSPGANWMPVYIHSKLMIIDDVFTTHGSANINTRSMQVDSEMNIAHEWASVTTEMRRRLWKLHTNGLGMQDNVEKAFKSWEDILNDNKSLQDNKEPPIASLVKFYYDKPILKDLD